MSFKHFFKQGISAVHVWPVIFLAFGLGPALAIYQSYHQMQGPDFRILKNFDTNEQFANRKFKYIENSVDHASYEHPRPKF